MSEGSAPTPHGGRSGGRMLAVVAALIVLSLIAIGVYAWEELGASSLTMHGYIALVLGTIGTIGLGVGLMALIFYSHRHGYDEGVGRGDEPPKR